MKQIKEWLPPYIQTKVDPVTVLPKVCMAKEDFEFIKALNLPTGSAVVKTGKYLNRNDDWHLNERHFYNKTKGLNNG